jgi:hypothetical protein
VRCALPANRQALRRQQLDAEHCIARLMIRTGVSSAELPGEELLHYADVVRTSGQHRPEHLAGSCSSRSACSTWRPEAASGPVPGSA